ncbi:MAG: molybdenum cofactor guanylyltransferase [Proteobacteria bacterium]|nr:molybdenum cofactor guanylyltransferase [Pseudomonadota bacterium]
MAVPEEVWGLVLAGGKSRRMGSDKASLKQGGETQLDRSMSLLGAHLDRVFVSARRDQADDPVRVKYEQILDRYSDLGPLAGILSAMDSDPEVSWLVLACDLPNVDDDTIAFLLGNASPDHLATAYRSTLDGMPEPLCAIYRPESRATIDRFVRDRIHCPRKILINSKTCLLEQPNPGALHNINSPDDLVGTGIELAS